MADTSLTNNDDKSDAIPLQKPESNATAVSLAAAFIVILVIASLLAYKSGIDPKKIEADVSAFKQTLKQRYASQGVDVQFDYDKLEAEGGIFEKKIILKKPSILIKSDKVHYEIDSSKAHIIPDDKEYKHMTIRLSSPVVLNNLRSGETIRYLSDKPVEIETSVGNTGQQNYGVTIQDGSRVEVVSEDTTKTYHIKTEDAFIDGTFSDNALGDYDLMIDLGKSTIEDGTSTYSFDAFAYDMDMSQDQELSMLHIEALRTDTVPESLLPVSVELNQQSSLDIATNQRTYKLEQLVINGNEFDIDVEGKVVMKPREILPFVKLQLVMNGASKVVDALHNQRYFDDSVGKVIVKSLKRISPEWDETSVMPLEFSIKRTADEPFMIGEMKADELVALALKEYFDLTATIPKSDTSKAAINNDGQAGSNSVELGKVEGKPQPKLQKTEKPVSLDAAVDDDISSDISSTIEKPEERSAVQDSIQPVKKNSRAPESTVLYEVPAAKIQEELDTTIIDDLINSDDKQPE